MCCLPQVKVELEKNPSLGLGIREGGMDHDGRVKPADQVCQPHTPVLFLSLSSPSPPPSLSLSASPSPLPSSSHKLLTHLFSIIYMYMRTYPVRKIL